MGGFEIDWYINVKIYSMGANFVLNSWMKFNSPEAESSYMAMGKTSVKFSYGNYLFHGNYLFLLSHADKSHCYTSQLKYVS